jgi:hypothetical protein
MEVIQHSLFACDPEEKGVKYQPVVFCACVHGDVSPKALFAIKPIGYHLAMRVVIERHYLHRKAPCSQAFGLFCKACSRIAGVVVYGTPSSSTLRAGLCGEEEKDNVIELTRLWIIDGTPKNTESYLIGNTLHRLSKEIVVSFADTEMQHIGVVYQATNWMYTGLSAKRTNWVVDGLDKHSQTIADKHSAANARAIYGDKFSLVDRSRKHRYVFFNCSKQRKKHLSAKLAYPVLPYPKQP